MTEKPFDICKADYGRQVHTDKSCTVSVTFCDTDGAADIPYETGGKRYSGIGIDRLPASYPS